MPRGHPAASRSDRRRQGPASSANASGALQRLFPSSSRSKSPRSSPCPSWPASRTRPPRRRGAQLDRLRQGDLMTDCFRAGLPTRRCARRGPPPDAGRAPAWRAARPRPRPGRLRLRSTPPMLKAGFLPDRIVGGEHSSVRARPAFRPPARPMSKLALPTHAATRSNKRRDCAATQALGRTWHGLGPVASDTVRGARGATMSSRTTFDYVDVLSAASGRRAPPQGLDIPSSAAHALALLPRRPPGRAPGGLAST